MLTWAWREILHFFPISNVAQGMDIQPLVASILKLLLFPIILYQFQKDPFCLIIL